MLHFAVTISAIVLNQSGLAESTEICETKLFWVYFLISTVIKRDTRIAECLLYIVI